MVFLCHGIPNVTVWTQVDTEGFSMLAVQVAICLTCIHAHRTLAYAIAY